MKRDVALKGLFNQPNLTPLESVNKTNLHDVLFLLNLQSLEAKENQQNEKKS
jgi:hypothetical protein